MEINQILKPLLGLGHAFEVIQTYLSVWQLPKSQRGIGNISDSFSKSRTNKWAKKHSLSFFAAEVVTLLPLLSHYVERPAIQRLLPLEVDSFRKITAVSQITKRAKLGLADADTLDKANVEHAEAYKPAYDGHVIPKNHYRFKFGRQIRRDGYLQDCFTLERKHSLAKEAAYATDYTGTFEKTVLSRTVSLHLDSLKSAKFSDGLVN